MYQAITGSVGFPLHRIASRMNGDKPNAEDSPYPLEPILVNLYLFFPLRVDIVTNWELPIAPRPFHNFPSVGNIFAFAGGGLFIRPFKTWPCCCCDREFSER